MPKLVGIRVDEPPVVVTGGSFQVDVTDMDDLTYALGDPPRRHKFNTNVHGDIGAVRVITERTDGKIGDILYHELPYGVQLMIWLRRVKMSGGPAEYDPVGVNDPPEVVVMGRPFRLESEDKLAKEHSRKSARPHRWKHPGMNRHFRIAKWRIVSSTGATLREDSGDDNYQLSVAFYHND